MTTRLTLSVLIGVAGLLVSAYLTATHYFAGEIPLACATGGAINCERVTNSLQSMLGPFPVALLGLAWFGLWLVLLRMHTSPFVLLAWTSIGVLSVLYLVYAELFLIGAICAWCTGVHAAVIALFLLAVAEATSPAPVPDLRLGTRR